MVLYFLATQQHVQEHGRPLFKNTCFLSQRSGLPLSFQATHPSLFTFKLAFHLNQPRINKIYRDRPARGAIPPGMDMLAPGSDLL